MLALERTIFDARKIKNFLTPSDTPSDSRPSALRSNRLAASLVEELAEGRGVGEVQAVGYLGDAQRGGLQQEGGLHQQHLAQELDAIIETLKK